MKQYRIGETVELILPNNTTKDVIINELHSFLGFNKMVSVHWDSDQGLKCFYRVPIANFRKKESHETVS